MEAAPPSPPLSRLTVCMPVLDDWVAVSALLDRFSARAGNWGVHIHALLVDDGSTTPAPPDLFRERSGIGGVRVLHLYRNVGHQRAIAIGLCRLGAEGIDQPVVVMDSDGEDMPEQVESLMDAFRKHRGEKIVFALRKKRSEGPAFFLAYRVYTLLFRMLTGKVIRFGNFSMMSPGHLQKVIHLSEIWNHYPAGVLKSRLPLTFVPLDRGTRVDGRSRMNLVSLIVHGLSAISVFGEVTGARVLVASGCVMALSLLGVGVVAGIRLFTDLAIPGWATFTSASLLIITLNLITLSLFFAFFILHGRDKEGIILTQRYQEYIRGESTSPAE